MATPEARASSLSTEATPPRVASRMQRSCGPAASSSASTAGHSEHVSDSTAASSSNSPRASMIAVPWSPIVPDTMMRSPGRRPAGDSDARSSTAPTPAVQRYIWSAWPRSTTLVSPATTCTPAASAARAIASTSPRSTSDGSPSSSTIDRLSASGRAPATARSLTVPLTASSPIDPPGKVIGLTTKLSVVSATSTPPIETVPASASAARAGEAKAGTKRPSISVCVALPPAPWAIVMCSSLKRGRLERAVSMIPRTRSSASRSRGPPPLTTDLPARARSARSCSRPRTRPRARPCTCRSRARACTRCRRPCTPTA